ncbi:flavodoxin [Odoribacter lunatus]|uniref:flavodoxin n=1 Tax=Odoribacter lunatus TaxID=2941335 RepID=UPI0020421F85|nr:flavodoxin [Odoribacter lunatus]
MENKEHPQLTADLEGNYLIEEKGADEKAIGLFYAPTGGSVHKVAKRIKQKIKNRKVDMRYLQDVKAEQFLHYKYIIIVSSTLGQDAWQNKGKDEWAAFMPEIRKLSLNGHLIALVGLGNYVLYPGNFADGLRSLANTFKERGATLIGATPADDYSFTSSQAVKDNMFVGLPIDEDNEADKTDARIEKWLSMILPEMEG